MSANIQIEVAFGKVFERVAADLYANRAWPGAQLIENPTYADLDFTIVSAEGKLIAFLEVKARRISVTRYESTIVSWRKHDAARWGQQFMKVPTICVVVFTDSFASFKLAEAPDGKETITRYDRGGDGVPHALYLHSRFTHHENLLLEVAERVRIEQGL